MKILTKRFVAYFIDVMIFAIIYHFAFYEIIDRIPDALLFLTVSPLLLKDIIFRNASIGKVMMGISIYSTSWKKPPVWKLACRSFLTMTIGYAKYCKDRFTYGRRNVKIAMIGNAIN